MLTPEQRAQVRQAIEDAIEDLEESIPRLRAQSGPVSPDAAIGRLSRTDSMINAQTVNIALKDSQAKLARLRNRLARVDEDGFDRCSLCDAPIEWPRLLAAPDRGVCPKCLQASRR